LGDMKGNMCLIQCDSKEFNVFQCEVEQ